MKEPIKKEANKRKNIRYPTGMNELVTVYYLDEKAGVTGQRVGLGQDESFKGYGVVFVGEVTFKVGQEVLCECGTLPKVASRIAWIRRLDDQVTKVGFTLIE